MAINKRKRSLKDKADAEIVAAGGAEPRPRTTPRSSTLVARVEHLEERTIADKLRHESLEKKLDDSFQEAERLRKELEDVKERLRKEQASVRRHKSALVHSTNSIMFQGRLDEQQKQHEAQLQRLESELAAAKEETRKAQDLCTTQERERRRLRSELEKKLEVAEKDARMLRLVNEEYHVTTKALREDLKQMRRSMSAIDPAIRKRTVMTQGPMDRSRDAVRMRNARLKDCLTNFIDTELQRDGGVHGEMAKAMLVTFFAENTSLLEHILTELQVYEKAEQKTVSAIEGRWTLDICTAIFIHGDLSYAGYQALINIMSKEYSFSEDSFQSIRLPYGTEMPKMQSKNKLHEHLKVIADIFGMKPLDHGKGVAVNIKNLVEARLQHMNNLATEQHPLPRHVKVQLSADAAGWRKRPSDPMLKNFSAFVVKVIHNIQRWEDDDEEEVRGNQRVGDAVNSLHNNKLALLYSGKDSYSMLQKFLTCKQDEGTPSVLEQLQDLRRAGVQLSSTTQRHDAQQVEISFLGGGDGKFQSEQAGLNGHASTFPCGRCECKKEHLHLSKHHLEHRHPNLCKRTLQRCTMMAHKFGEEFGLTEPYHCPGCGLEITAEDQHLPVTDAAIKAYPGQHYGQYPDKQPLLPIELWDFVPDLLHAQLRTVVNMFFVTISMNLPNETKARELCIFMEERIKVAAEPVFNQGSRESTKKTLQTWTGKECWRVLNGIDDILGHVYPVGSQAYAQLKGIWDAWKELHAVLLIEDVPQDKWNALADVVDNKAAMWHQAFLAVTGTQDVTPIMHEIVCHYGDYIRLHGPLGPYSSDGLEARHQPIKRLSKHRTNRRGFSAKGSEGHNTDIVQVMKRMCATEHVQAKLPKGKGAVKFTGHSLLDSLSAYIATRQTITLVQLGIMSEEDAATKQAEIVDAQMSADAMR